MTETGAERGMLWERKQARKISRQAGRGTSAHGNRKI
jgi:hypothetical protein